MAQCPICNGKIYLMEGVKTQDGSICSECARIVSSPKNYTTEKIRSFWKKNHTRWTTFKETKVLHSPGSLNISVDEKHRYFLFGRGKGNNQEKVVYSFDEVDSYEFITIKGETVTHKKGILTRAVVGGMLAGAAGAVIGGATAGSVVETTPDRTKIKVHLTTAFGKVCEISPSNCPYPEGFTDFLDRCIYGDVYDDRQSKAASAVAPTVSPSAADEILKYKALLDQGIITEEEFQAKKSKLLDL